MVKKIRPEIDCRSNFSHQISPCAEFRCPCITRNCRAFYSGCMRMLLFSHYIHFGRSVWSVIGSHVTLTGPLRLQEEFISVGRHDMVTYPHAPHLRLSPSLTRATFCQRERKPIRRRDSAVPPSAPFLPKTNLPPLRLDTEAVSIAFRLMCGHAGQLFFLARVPAKRMCRLIGGDTSKRDGAASGDWVVGGGFF